MAGVIVVYDVLKEGNVNTQELYFEGTEKEIENFKQSVLAGGINFLQAFNQNKIVQIVRIVENVRGREQSKGNVEQSKGKEKKRQVKDGNCTEVKNKKQKLLHKVTDGLITREYMDGKLFRETKVYPSGSKEYERWYKNGKKHREQTGKFGPAETHWHENGRKKYEGWYKNGRLHREQFGSSGTTSGSKNDFGFENESSEFGTEDSPAEIGWYANGNKAFVNWCYNGVKHRDESLGPAEILYKVNGDLYCKDWYKYGVYLYSERF